MGIILASVLTFFLNKKEKNKILASLLIVYIILLEVVKYTRLPTLTDYLLIYSFCSFCMFTVLILHCEKLYLRVLTLLSVILPHSYYLLILYKPYLLHPQTPLWFLINADSFFHYGIFFMLYEQSRNYSFKGISFKDYILNAMILSLLILF